MCRLGVDEWLVSVIIAMYTSARTVVSRVCHNSNCFEPVFRMCQGLALSPLVFEIVTAISRQLRDVLP